MTAPVLALILAGAPTAAAPPGIRWERSFEVALRKAKAQGKPVFVDFWAPWCGWCQRLDETTYVDPEVVRLSKDFVAVKVNTEGGRNETLVALRYNVSDLPTMAFLSPGGRSIARVTGFQGPGQFPRELTIAREAAREFISWERSIDKNPRDGEALTKMGLYLFDQEAYEESRDVLVQAVRFDEGLPSAERKRSRMMLAIVRHYERRFRDAEVLLKEAIALRPPGPNEAQLLYILGRVYKAWGHDDRAREVLAQVVQSFPQSPFAQRAQDTLVALDRRR
jgi:thiol-disulfide isomerase/thioredoxin